MTIPYQVPVTVSPETTLAETAELMDRAGVGSLLVVDGGRLVGIVTDRDLALRAVARRVPHDGRVDAVMTSGVVTAAVTAGRDEVVRTLQEHTIRRLPLMDGDRVAGIVTLDDLLADADLADLPGVAALVGAEMRHPHHEAGPLVPTGSARAAKARRPGPGKAWAGDRIVVHRHTLDEPDRVGEILEVRSSAGGPPFRVRWSDTGQVSFFYPGPDAEIRHVARVARPH
ncbi:DUF1918 domain-containing protein [Frankia sp. CNm7]|uniref:DUF1918 domain-containing protein n=1 Tax=Frankia nepalensis TaxID=1836974 RepID=A0A937RGM1_9ACTN|nr:DUF1918 domain-containing protein [Frankia nepalensis]MBL7499477.1 DUF1918 domain-containing protein [Frankia nepalensis]MBL7515368.1 DUF1918 domain-containing protein [Frankia nepalensis]MBL7523085.1 DUF1918 domain-containing protein [Frankia nepalensis]MBL7631851.1 DUF1918 domain-containing protein [Frankia nepalensis]